MTARTNEDVAKLLGIATCAAIEHGYDGVIVVGVDLVNGVVVATFSSVGFEASAVPELLRDIADQGKGITPRDVRNAH